MGLEHGQFSFQLVPTKLCQIDKMRGKLAERKTIHDVNYSLFYANFAHQPESYVIDDQVLQEECYITENRVHCYYSNQNIEDHYSFGCNSFWHLASVPIGIYDI